MGPDRPEEWNDHRVWFAVSDAMEDYVAAVLEAVDGGQRQQSIGISVGGAPDAILRFDAQTAWDEALRKRWDPSCFAAAVAVATEVCRCSSRTLCGF